MKGINVTKLNGKVVFVNVIDECGSQVVPYTVDQYEARGYEPDWRTLPDENEIKQQELVAARPFQ